MQASGQRFDPARLHHFQVRKTIRRTQRASLAVVLREKAAAGSFDIVKRCFFVPFDPHPGEEQGKHVNSG